MAWSNLLIFGFLMYLSTGCYGEIVLKPEHRIGREGQHTIFTCKSDAIGKPLKWQYSAFGQKDFVPVYHSNTSVEPLFVGKMIVNQSEIDGMVFSTLEIKNSTLADAGVFSCQDDAPVGRTADAIFSVTQDIKCKAACTEDSLWVQCYTCYRSEELLKFVLILNNAALIPANITDDTDDKEKGCKQIESNWILKMPCNSIPESHISVMLWENEKHTNISSYGIRILTDESSGTTTTAKTQNATNPPENDCKDQNAKTSLHIVVGVLGAVVFVMSMAIIELVVFICRQKQRQPPQPLKSNDAETPLNDLMGSNNNSPRSSPRVAHREVY